MNVYVYVLIDPSGDRGPKHRLTAAIMYQRRMEEEGLTREWGTSNEIRIQIRAACDMGLIQWTRDGDVRDVNNTDGI